MESIDFEGFQGVFGSKWYEVFFVDFRLGKLKEQRRLEIN